jgi:formate-dependent phosphoribosylglycinamide formyltransferase (GAR transformylase)
MSRTSPKVLLIYATLWWPLAARLAIRFRNLGCRVNAICPPVHPLRSVRGIEHCYSIRTLSIQQSLIDAIEGTQADYVVPTDDRAIWQLHALAASHPQYRELVTRSIGEARGFEIVRSRVRLLALAESIQIRTPWTVSLASLDDAVSYGKEWTYPALVKRDGTCGGRGVTFVRTPKELVNAYRRLSRKESALATLKRRIVDGDILAFARPPAQFSQEISLQDFVAGTPANAMYACFQGEILASMQVRTICAQHATGAALIAERISDPRIEEAGRKLAKALALSGFFGLDFLLEDGHGSPYLLEMNPRATQLGHLPLENSNAGRSLVEALWHAWTGSPPTTSPASAPLPRRIAFYPQALALGADNSLLSSAWLDRPDQEPELVQELSRMGWPERRLIYRLFHCFYTALPDKPVVFPDSEKASDVNEFADRA